MESVTFNHKTSQPPDYFPEEGSFLLVPRNDWAKRHLGRGNFMVPSPISATRVAGETSALSASYSLFIIHYSLLSPLYSPFPKIRDNCSKYFFKIEAILSWKVRETSIQPLPPFPILHQP
jgi:hypothetical protein